MSACPSCGAEILGGSACSKCGGRTLALDVPDLDLSPMSAPQPAPQVRRTSGVVAVAMVDEDVLGDDAGGASFELAMTPEPTPPVSQNVSQNMPHAGIPRRTTSGSMGRISGAPQETSRPDVRTSTPPEDEPPRIDPLEARAFADYGEPPAGVLQTPIYAFRVKMRQSELRRGLWRAKVAFERAQKEQARALADASRLEEVKMRLAADVEAKEREVDLHEAALLAFDAPAMKRGTQIVFASGAALFLLLFLPVFFRMCIGVDAPPLNPQ